MRAGIGTSNSRPPSASRRTHSHSVSEMAPWPRDFASNPEASRVDLKNSPLPEKARGPGFAAMFVLLFVLLSLLFYGVYLPGHTLFSNDGPLARLMSQCHQLPER